MTLVGFIGLGIMGKPMAYHLLRAGYPLTVHNRSHAPVDELAAAGAYTAHSPREVAATSDLILTMLPDPATVGQVIGGRNGVLEGCRTGAIVIDLSTSDPRLARDLAGRGAEQGVPVLDAPVSGGEMGAREATLAIMVGGEREAFERVLPVLQHLGKNIVHVGDAGAGQVVKAANQMIVGLTIEAVAEALTLVQRAGLDPERARQAMLGGFASSRVLEVHGRRMITEDFAPGGRIRTHTKDLRIALDVARELTLNLPGTRLVESLLEQMVERGLGDLDHAALVKAVRGDLD
jgi:2-hydroxy-3-oxopropionate reductase